MNLDPRQIAIYCAAALGAKQYKMGDKQGLYQANLIDQDSMPFFLNNRGRVTGGWFDPLHNDHDTYHVLTSLPIKLDFEKDVVKATLRFNGQYYSCDEPINENQKKATTTAICMVAARYGLQQYEKG